jgi:uncharacterized membrane protein
VRVPLLGLPLDALYLALCAPFVLLLTYVLPPFQSPDEAAHFYRAVQLSHGEILPVTVQTPDRLGAGGLVEQSAGDLVSRYCGVPNWSCKRMTRPGLAEILGTGTAEHIRSPRHATAFSNTVVFFPIAHAAPAVGIAIARQAGLPATGWFYAGRLANAMLAIGASWAALRILRGRKAARLVFAVAALPMVISIAPTLSADSGVVSCSLLLLAASIRLTETSADHRWFWPALILAVLVAAVGKLAYLPLAVIPVACAVVARSTRGMLVGTALVAAFAVAVTLVWSAVTHPYVFPISPDPNVDVFRQMAHIRAHPFYFVAVICRSMLGDAPIAALTLIGWKLTSSAVVLPWAILAFSGSTLLLALATSGFRTSLALQFRLFMLLVIAVSAFTTFAFLYLQNTPVGVIAVHGYQGRYLLPLLPFAALFIPRLITTSSAGEGRVQPLLVLGGVSGAMTTTLFLALRIWS